MSLKERWVILCVLLLPVLILPQTGLAETVVLKSGKKIVGKILGPTEDRSAIIMEIRGKRIAYRFTDIDYIKEERESPGASILPMYGCIWRKASSPC